MDHQKQINKKIKLEPLEDAWSIEEKEIKLEQPEDTWDHRKIKLESLEIVEEELLDSPPKLEIMNEPLELTESKLEEPDHPKIDRLSEFEYPAYLKLEPVEKNDIDSRRILYSSFSSHTERTPSKRKCSVCSDYVSSKSITQMDHVNRRSILLVGLVLSGRKTMEEANEMMSIKKLPTCRNHLSEAIHAIYRTLNIKNVHELETRSPENMGEMISTVYAIGHKWMDTARFKMFLFDIVCRINPLVKEIGKPVQQSAFASRKHRCSVCFAFRSSEQLAHIDNGNELVLAVEFILAGKRSLEEAKLLLFPLKACKIHLPEAVNAIFILLRILNMGELETCTINNELTLMSVVKGLKDNCDFVQFGKLLESFIRKMDPHLIPAYIGNMRKNTKNLKCPICWCLLEKTDKFVVIEEENRKLILLVGLVLGGKKTIAEARLAMSTQNYPVCRIHLSDALVEISKILIINEPNEMQTCPTDRMTSFMNIVRMISPGLQVTHFNNFLLDFVLKIDA